MAKLSDKIVQNAQGGVASASNLQRAPSISFYDIQRLHLDGSVGRMRGARTEPLRHETPSLLWISRGQGALSIGGVSTGFSANSLVYVPAGMVYTLETGLALLGKRIALPLDPELDLPAAPLHFRLRETRDQMELAQLIDNLQTEIDARAPNMARGIALRGGLLALWFERLAAKADENAEVVNNASSRLVLQFSRLLDEKYRETHAVGDYAEALGVSAGHLSRVCRIASGKKATEVIADRLKLEAGKMLSDTDMSVASISDHLGFHSPAYFSRFFNRHAGKSPRDFRKSA